MVRFCETLMERLMHWFEGNIEKWLKIIFINFWLVLLFDKLWLELSWPHFIMATFSVTLLDVFYELKVAVMRWVSFYGAGRVELVEVIKSDFEHYEFPQLSCEKDRVEEYFRDIKDDESNWEEVRLEAARYYGWLNGGWFFADVDKTKRKQVYLALSDVIAEQVG